MKRRNDIIRKGDKILELFEENKRFVPYIKSTTDLCDDILSKIKIGRGSQGKVYKIKFRNDRKTYVMKKIYPYSYYVTDEDKDKLIKMISKKTKNVSKLTMKEFIIDIMDYYDLIDRVSWRKILTYNHLSKSMIPSYDMLDNLFLPVEDIDCKIFQTKKYPYNLGIDGYIEVIEGDYICFSSIFLETVISLLASQLARNNICYHYVNFYSSINCGDSFNYFIEKMDVSLEEAVHDWDIGINEFFDVSNLFSVLVGIFILSDQYSICHNDLAFRNILIKKTEKIENINKSKTITYIIDDTIFEFPLPSYMYKISDFGFSQKFTHPMILDYEILTYTDVIFPNFDTYGLYDLFKFLSDVILCIYSDLFEDTKKCIDSLLKLLFGSRDKAFDMIYNTNKSINREKQHIVAELLINTKLILDTNTLIKVFKKYIVNTKSDKSFIATNYYSKK